MAVQSIWTPVQIRNIAGDHLLMPSREMAFGEVDGIGELNYLLEEIRSCAETLDNARDLLPSRSCSPKIVSSGGFAGGLSIFNDSDLGGDPAWLLRILRTLRSLSVARHPGFLGWYVTGKGQKLN